MHRIAMKEPAGVAECVTRGPYAVGIPESEGAWWESAACLDVDPDVFITSEGISRSTQRELEAQAKEVCLTCPVREQCLADALARGEKYGIWGGLNPKERRRLEYGGAPGGRVVGLGQTARFAS